VPGVVARGRKRRPRGPVTASLTGGAFRASIKETVTAARAQCTRAAGRDYSVTVPPAATILVWAEPETLSTVTVSFTSMSP
jgi:hypothetical protein